MRSFGWMSLAMLLAPERALAFSSASKFDQDAIYGGGGGRHFTGAPGDGYGCAVCHLSEEQPAWELEGLPEQFVPGGVYPLTLRWDDEGAPAFVGAQLEIVDDEGMQAGELTVGPPADAQLDERCEMMETGIPAVRGVTFDSRQLVMVDGCSGPTAARFTWTAPRTDTAILYLGMVARGMPVGNPAGDRVVGHSVAISAVGAPPPSLSAPQSCAVGPGRSLGPMWLVVVWLVRRAR